MQLAYLNAAEAELLGALISEAASFVVIGGHAVLAYSSPERSDGSTRTLGDLDVLVNPTIDNLDHVSRALARLRISISAEQLDAMYKSKQLPNLTGGYQTQLLSKISGCDAAEVLQSPQIAWSSVGPVPIISKPHLIANKRAAARPKDLDDVRALESSESEQRSC